MHQKLQHRGEKAGDDITFLRRIVRGPADDSYGIEVAKLAGVPDSVVARAKGDSKTNRERRHGAAPARVLPDRFESDDGQLSLMPAADNELIRRLKDMDVNTLTPIEALQTLYDICKGSRGILTRRRFINGVKSGSGACRNAGRRAPQPARLYETTICLHSIPFSLRQQRRPGNAGVRVQSSLTCLPSQRRSLMPKIQVLDKHTAELIAAGRSWNARLRGQGADGKRHRRRGGHHQVEIRGGGAAYIGITDNGCGIARDDVPTAFLRHATSKIRREEDLEAIGTLGFRGEALASIAAVARVELVTRTADELAGTRYVIEGGVETAVEDAGCPQRFDHLRAGSVL